METNNSMRCDFCKYFDERFDEFGHLQPAKCKFTGRFTNWGSTCVHFMHKWMEDGFYTDVNDEE